MKHKYGFETIQFIAVTNMVLYDAFRIYKNSSHRSKVMNKNKITSN